MADPVEEHYLDLTRRELFQKSAAGIGAVALGSLMNNNIIARNHLLEYWSMGSPHFAAKAKPLIDLLSLQKPCGKPSLK